MDDLDTRIMLALRPLKSLVVALAGELERREPGALLRIEAIIDSPNRELQATTPEQKKELEQTKSLLVRARQYAATEI